MPAYYNEIDPYAAQWLRNLIAADLIAPGDVDDRSIEDVKPIELTNYTQCHFFAGIGGWSFALRLAGWPDDRHVWTGSCPCQPFSCIGKGKGFEDERHLWPEFYRIIRESRPATIFGEQVATSGVWLDLVLADLEISDYACAAADIPAASIGTRHERMRTWFVADRNKARRENTQRISTAKEEANIRTASSLVCGKEFRDIHRSLEPDQSWVIDGLFGEGNTVSAYGNAIVPQVAAEFIKAYMECRP